jgi:hypothetical protein
MASEQVHKSIRSLFSSLKKPLLIGIAERYMKFVADTHVHLGKIITQDTNNDFDTSKQTALQWTVSQLERLFLTESFIADFKQAGINLSQLTVQSAQLDIKQQVQPSSSKDHEDPVDDDDGISDGCFFGHTF